MFLPLPPGRPSQLWWGGLVTHNVHIHSEIFMAPIVALMGGKADLLLRYEDATLNPGPASPSPLCASWSVCGKPNLACELCGLMKFPLVWVIARLIACWVVSEWSLGACWESHRKMLPCLRPTEVTVDSCALSSCLLHLPW